ncbi:hypothetical protein [Rasiella sp. SM2506]|uniref:hypothetical protein n=1 Tax=Rasiella sp. SM2506 TaxID=3423914 RepID=UPI003D7B324E
MKYKGWILLFFVTSIGFSQNVVITQSATNVSLYHTEVFLLNDADNRLVFVQKNKKDIHITLYGVNFEPGDQFVLAEVLDANQQMLLSSVYDNKLAILTGNSSRKKLTALHIDLDTKKVLSKTELPKLRGEGLLQTYFYEGSHYILSVSLDSEVLFFQKIGPEGVIKKETFDLSSYTFKTKTSKNESLKYLFNYAAPDLQKINDTFPYTLLQTSSKCKSYQLDDRIQITLDHDVSKTMILEIDLPEMTFEMVEIEKPLLTKGTSGNSNSLLHGGRMYQLIMDTNEMILEVKESATLQSLYTYRVGADEEIVIKNTPIILEGAAYASKRKLGKTQQFLRKVSNSNPAISVHQLEDQLQVVLGGSVQMASGISDFGGTMLLTHFSSIPQILSTNENARTTYIQCLFDEDFKHLDGSIVQTVFDKIERYHTESDLKKETLETIVDFNESYIYVVLQDDEYRFVKFDK